MPFYTPPTLLLKQAITLSVFKYTTKWRGLSLWMKDILKLCKVAAGAIGLGCFGYPIHPVYEVTSNCNLRCLHCHARGGEKAGKELNTKEAKGVIENLAEVPEFRTLVFTGGEPLVRKDIFELLAFASNIGFNTVVATNATLITEEIARKLKCSGVEGIAASIDFVRPEEHDAYRGMKGAFKAALRGIENANKVGMYIQINTTISKRNLNQLTGLLKLADRINAHVVLLYQLLPSGRGEALLNETLDTEEFSMLVNKVYEIQSEVNPVIVPIGLPEYFAYLASSGRVSPKLAFKIFKGCIAGRGMFYIKPNGDVWGCPFLPINAGNLLEKSSKEIWNGEFFNTFRDRSNLKGYCRECIFREICGGCRARAYAYSGDPLSSDPFCPLHEKTNLAKSKMVFQKNLC
jgi:radical SAM protein with 4Fe4S-binding SPASM domain